MDVADFDFDLPDELIAQEPASERGGSRLLVFDRRSGAVHDASFAELAQFLVPGDLLVLNNTRVFPARLLGRRVPSGGAVEVMLLASLSSSQLPTTKSQAANGDAGQGGGDATWATSPGDTSPAGSVGSWELDGGRSQMWQALVHPGQKLKPGARVLFEGDDVRLQGEILARHFHGRRTIRLWREDGGPVMEAVERIGHMPLPPYIKRDDTAADHVRYQTVYARERGSIAAPTAGLHFTAALLDALAAAGVDRTEITLHVGYGTFKPVRADRVEDHVVDPETFSVSAEAGAALSRARRERRRIIAVGTTTTRALESLPVSDDAEVTAYSGTTSLFIHPGHQFRLVDGLITNFHLPRSSLLMLVAAFAGRERVLAAYRHAVAQRYRFYSYGDAMLIL